MCLNLYAFCSGLEAECAEQGGKTGGEHAAAGAAADQRPRVHRPGAAAAGRAPSQSDAPQAPEAGEARAQVLQQGADREAEELDGPLQTQIAQSAADLRPHPPGHQSASASHPRGTHPPRNFAPQAPRKTRCARKVSTRNHKLWELFQVDCFWFVNHIFF